MAECHAISGRWPIVVVMAEWWFIEVSPARTRYRLAKISHRSADLREPSDQRIPAPAAVSAEGTGAYLCPTG